jgi:hypothetical protein
MVDVVDHKDIPIVSKTENFRTAQQARRKKEVRPEKAEDIAERNQIYHGMKEAVNHIPPNIPLRFHGCHSFDLDKIARSGVLQSGFDLTGESTSFDAKGSISVTTPSTIVETLGDLEAAQKIRESGKKVEKAGYIDILDNEVPLGCTFILMPGSEVDAQRGENGGNVMSNVDLHSPNFVGLLASSEFYQRAQGIMIMHGLPPEIVVKYTDLPQKLPGICEQVSQSFPYTEIYQPAKRQSDFTFTLD